MYTVIVVVLVVVFLAAAVNMNVVLVVLCSVNAVDVAWGSDPTFTMVVVVLVVVLVAVVNMFVVIIVMCAPMLYLGSDPCLRFFNFSMIDVFSDIASNLFLSMFIRSCSSLLCPTN